MRQSIIIILLILSVDSFGQSQEKDIQAFFKSVAYIYDQKIVTEKINKKEYEIWYQDKVTKKAFPKTYANTGTGFFVYTDLDTYLVTAEHVANYTTMNTIVLISDQNGVTVQVLLKDIIKSDTIVWTLHPVSDVAVIQLDESKIEGKLKLQPIPFELIMPKLEAPMRIRDVTVYGYPLSLGISNRITPITKTSRPSSGIIEHVRADKPKVLAPFFLLDDPSVSGFSGGPVFELPQELVNKTGSLYVTAYRLMGLVHGSISKDAGGFAAIVPAIEIKKTIEDAPGYSGKHIFKYPDGKVWSERIYKNGIPWNVISNFNKNSENQDKGTLTNGTGSLNIYDLEGKLIEIRQYRNGSLIKTENL